MDEFLRKLKELLKDVEGVDFASVEAELKALVDDKTDKQKLLVKNKELLDARKTLEARVAELEKQVEGVDVEEFERLKAVEEAYLKDPNNKIDIDAIKSKVEVTWQNKLKLKENELVEAKKALEDTNAKLEGMLVDQQLEDSFNKGRKILDSHRPLLKVYFKSKVRVEQDGDERTVYVKDGTGGELPIEDFFEYWKGTEDAKQYLEADYTSGAGIHNNKTGGSFKNKKPWAEMTIKERVTLFQENPAEYARLKSEASKR